jgi:hypothetical protein
VLSFHNPLLLHLPFRRLDETAASKEYMMAALQAAAGEVHHHP